MATVARVRMLFTGVAGTPGYLNLYFDADTSTAGAYQAATLDALVDFIDHVGTGCVVTAVNPIPIIDVATGAVVDVAVGAGGNFTFTGGTDLLPLATNGLARHHTGVFIGGRELRGRSFLPYPVESQSDLGKPSAGYITALNSLFSTLQDVSHANGAFVVYSPTHHQMAAVTGSDAWNQWAVLRSRRD